MFYLVVALIAIVTLYLYGTRNYKHWEKKRVKHDKPLPFFGNNLNNYRMKKSVTQIADELYWKYPDEKVVGYYRNSYPELVIRDPEIAKRILITDFGSFYPRGINSHKTVIELLLKNLFFADGDLWRLLRQRMTPAFTSCERLGLMQSLAVLAAVLSRYTVEPAPQSLKCPVVNPSSNIVQSIQDGIPLLFKERPSKFEVLALRILAVHFKMYILETYLTLIYFYE